LEYTVQKEIPRNRFLSAAVVIVAGFALSIMFAKSSRADFAPFPYIYDCAVQPCALKDPVNVIFSGNGSRPTSVGHVFHHMPWFNTWGTNMTFVDHWVTEGTDYQTADTPWFWAGARHHQRYNQGADADPNPGGWGIWTQGPIHYEVVSTFPPCGHMAVTFDGAKDLMRDAFAWNGQHIWGEVYIGNDQASLQCNQQLWTAGDGYLLWLHIP
jgi:hypothetical protein